MTAKKTDDAADVTIYPTGEAWIPDVEPVEQTVSAERAEELLAYTPAAFTTTKPKVVDVPETVTPPSTETPPAVAGTETKEA